MNPLPANRLKYVKPLRYHVGYFHDDTWGFTVHLVVNIDGKRLMEYCKKMFPEDTFEFDDSEDWCGRHVMLQFESEKHGYEVHVVALRKFEWTPHWMSALSHELMHCTHAVLNRRGMTLSDATMETYCYTLDSLVKRCLEMLKRK